MNSYWNKERPIHQDVCPYQEEGSVRPQHAERWHQKRLAEVKMLNTEAKGLQG